MRSGRVNVVATDSKFIYSQLSDIQTLDETNNQILMVISISNHSSGCLVKDLNLNISDSGSVELIRDSELDRFDDIKLDFQLNCQQTREVQFGFKVSDCSVAHKIRGTLTYKYQVCWRAVLIARTGFNYLECS